MNRVLIASLCFILVQAEAASAARVWTDATGNYTVEADLIAFSDKQVVLQRADRELVAFPIEQLSEKDREYLKSREASESMQKTVGGMQTWTLRSGMKITGRIVDFADRDMTIQRRRGRIYVNNRVYENLPKLYQALIPKVVAHFEDLPDESQQEFEKWVLAQRGQPRTFHLEGVVMELENGDEYVVPFFFFRSEDLAVLKAGWDDWLAVHREGDHDARAEHAFMLHSLAAARHADQKVQREIARLQLQLQAVEAGVTALWEVTLYPGPGHAGPPLWVVVPGRDSRQASVVALERNPGYVVGPVRRVSR